MTFLEVRDSERLRLITGPPGGSSYPTLAEDDLPRSPYDASGSGTAHTEWDDAWQTASLVNGWATYGSGYSYARYRRLIGGLVVIEGLVTGGTANAAMFYLPVGYRIAASQIFAGYCAIGVSRLQINPDGTVYYPYSGSTSWHSLECVFFAEA